MTTAISHRCDRVMEAAAAAGRLIKDHKSLTIATLGGLYFGGPILAACLAVGTFALEQGRVSRLYLPFHQVINQSAHPFKKGVNTVVILCDQHNDISYNYQNSSVINQHARDCDLMLTEVVDRDQDLSAISRDQLLQMTKGVKRTKKFSIQGWDNKDKYRKFSATLKAIEMEIVHLIDLIKLPPQETYSHMTLFLDKISYLNIYFKMALDSCDHDLVRTELVQSLTNQIDKLKMTHLLLDTFVKNTTICNSLDGQQGIDLEQELNLKELVLGVFRDVGNLFVRLTEQYQTGTMPSRDRSLIESLQAEVSGSDRRIFLVAGKDHILSPHTNALTPHIQDFVADCGRKRIEWLILDKKRTPNASNHLQNSD